MKKSFLLLCLSLAAGAFLLSLATGATSISLLAPKGREETILLSLRLPRALSAFLVGGSLSLSGAIFQGLFRNPLADSYLLGIASGAGLGAAAAIVLGFASPLAFVSSVTLFSFLGAVLALLLVFFFAQVHGFVSTFRLLLAGLGVGLFLSSLVAFLMIVAEEELKALVFFFLGGFSTASWTSALLLLFFVPPAVWAASAFSQEMNLLLLGEETAQSSGLNVVFFQRLYALLAAFLTSLAVAVAGLIGFVGLIVPHILRILFGSDHRLLFPFSFLLGGAFLLLCDTLAKTLFSPAELPVGVITSLIGVPFFLWLLKREGREYLM